MAAAAAMPVNPDNRNLPESWVEEYDERRQKWFYKQTSKNPPRISYVHPLGALKPANGALPTQRTTPILNIRGQTQRAQSTPEVRPQSELEQGTYAQQMYRHASVTVLSPSAAASPAKSQPHLPAHMRQKLSAPPSPTSPPQSATGSELGNTVPSKRASLGGRIASSRPSSTSSSPASGPEGTRALFTALQLPSRPQTLSVPNGADSSSSNTSPLADSLHYGFDNPLPPLPGQITPPAATSLHQRPLSYSYPHPPALQPGSPTHASFTAAPSRPPSGDYMSPAFGSTYAPTSYETSPLSTTVPANPPMISPPLPPPHVQHSVQRPTSSSPTNSISGRIPFAPPPPPPLVPPVQGNQRGPHLPNHSSGHVQTNGHQQPNQHQSYQHPLPNQSSQPSTPPVPQYQPAQYQPNQPTQYQPTQFEINQHQPLSPLPSSPAPQYQLTQYELTQYQPARPAQYQPNQPAPYQPTQFGPTQYHSPLPPPHSSPPQQHQPPAASSSKPGLMDVLKTGYKVYQHINGPTSEKPPAGSSASTSNGSAGSGTTEVDITITYDGTIPTNGGVDPSEYFSGDGGDNTTSNGFDFSNAWSTLPGGGSAGTDNTDVLQNAVAGLNLGQSDSSGDSNAAIDAFNTFMGQTQNGDDGGGFGDNAPPYDPGF